MPNYSHDTGTGDATVTVPAGYRVKSYECIAGASGATITITPKGGTAQPAITIPAGAAKEDSFTTNVNDQDSYVELPGGSTIAFAGVVYYLVRYT